MANDVWAALGQPKHYIEPFFGSGAVLLMRPDYQPRVHIESVNDRDGFVANVWRSLQFSPDEVAKWCDWPVNHADLMARKAALIRNEGRLLEGLADDTWHDPVMAGYWIWAASCWIGSGLTSPGQIPHIGNGGTGVHALGKRPHLSTMGMGVHALGKIPHIGNGGKGVHALGKRPHLSTGGVGVTEPYNPNLYAWFRELSERLRHVRVVCGDWTRICGGNWQDNGGIVGIFMDPPYSGDIGRNNAIYHQEDLTVAAQVREWCLVRGSKPSYRIVLAGYWEEHQGLLEHGWTAKNWKAQGGYSGTSRDGKQDNPGKANRHREALFFSPHCQAGGKLW